MVLLRIDCRQARLGIDYRPAPVKIEQKPADLSVRQDPARVEIEPAQTRVVIDNRPPHRDIGLKNPLLLGLEAAQSGRQAVREYAAKQARQGDRLANAHLPGDEIAQIAKEESQDKTETNFDRIPKHPPIIRFVGRTQPEINIEPVPPTVQARPNWPEIKVGRHQVKTYLLQKPDVEITWVGSRLDYVL